MTYRFDERKPVPRRTFAQAARAMSELVSTAMDELLFELDSLEVPRELIPVTVPAAPVGPPAPEPDREVEEPTPTRMRRQSPPSPPEPDDAGDTGTIYVPEQPPE